MRIRLPSLATVLVITCVAISGCSALLPNLSGYAKNDQDKPTSDTKCITDSYPQAQQCALSTIIEISGMLASTGKFDRAIAYTTLSLAVATGGALAYERSKDTLRGFAVASGGLLGLNSTVKTTEQRTILNNGLRALVCSLRTAMAIDKTTNPITGTLRADMEVANSLFFHNVSSNFVSEVAKSRGMMLDNSVTTSNPIAIQLIANERASTISVLNKTDLLSQSLKSAGNSAGTKLSIAVIDIRSQIRSQLAGITLLSDDSMQSQSSRVVDMAGELIRRRSQLQEQMGQATLDANQKKTTYNLVVGSSDISEILEACVDKPTQTALTK